MPKKKSYNFKPLQGSSTSTGRAGGSKDGTRSDTISVNERLSELRNAPTPDAEQRKRELAAIVNQHSIPPNLRGILGVPESAPPQARPGVRVRDRLRIPGPAPPSSWLRGITSWNPTLVLRGGRRKTKRRDAHVAERTKPPEVLRFARLTGLDDGHRENMTSLTHFSSKTIALRWDMLDEEDYPFLVEVPLRLRLRLLSYIASYGPAIDIQAFQALTQGTEHVFQLDLAGLVGHRGLSLSRLVKAIRPQIENTEMNALSTLAESWEQEEYVRSSIGHGVHLSRFSNLTHLCLSHPASTVLWRDLLALSRHTAQLTHLSLAHWPRPTLTPNLTTATVASQHGPDINAGGSHFYSTLDQDMSEPASLLKQLSGNLLRLQWLDLEGCSHWMPALAYLSPSEPEMPPVGAHEDEWIERRPTVTTVISNTWKNLMYIRVAQGWLPDTQGVRALSRQSTEANARLIKNLLLKLEPSDRQFTNDELGSARQKASTWLDTELRVLSAGRSINNVRRAHKCQPVVLDLGWTQRPV